MNMTAVETLFVLQKRVWTQQTQVDFSVMATKTLKLTSADGKPTNAEDALKSYGAYDGEDEGREQFLQKLDAEKKNWFV